MSNSVDFVALGLFALVSTLSSAQGDPQKAAIAPPPLLSAGSISYNGHDTPYRVRHLPISSYPDLPQRFSDLLTQRRCVIPQTYQARRPENVIHASLERAGSSDWAALCSVNGTVSLVVFFSATPTRLSVLASSPETARLQLHDVTGILGFNWGIDPASPQQVHEAQAGFALRPKLLDHDALADRVVDHHTLYRFYSSNQWALLEMPDE